MALVSIVQKTSQHFRKERKRRTRCNQRTNPVTKTMNSSLRSRLPDTSLPVPVAGGLTPGGIIFSPCSAVCRLPPQLPSPQGLSARDSPHLPARLRGGEEQRLHVRRLRAQVPAGEEGCDRGGGVQGRGGLVHAGAEHNFSIFETQNVLKMRLWRRL